MLFTSVCKKIHLIESLSLVPQLPNYIPKTETILRICLHAIKWPENFKTICPNNHLHFDPCIIKAFNPVILLNSPSQSSSPSQSLLVTNNYLVAPMYSLYIYFIRTVKHSAEQFFDFVAIVFGGFLPPNLDTGFLKSWYLTLNSSLIVVIT